jgi:hypothetical protein
MKLKVVCLAPMLALGLVGCAKKWAGDPQLVHKLAINMPEADVKKLMGEPSLVNKMEVMGIVTETWVYNGSQQVGLVVQDGKLVSAQLDGKMIMQASVQDL